MIFEFLGIVLFLAIFFVFSKKSEKSKNNKQIPVEKRQQLCGTARVVEDNKLKFIHTGCSVDRKATFDEVMPGTSPFGDDGFEWEHENALIGEGYTMGNL